MKCAYLAVPYSSPDLWLREQRTHAADFYAAELAARGYSVFSPISQGHRMAVFLPEEHLFSHEFWMAQCLPWLRVAQVLMVVPLPGWRESRGVQFELSYASSNGLDITVLQGPAELEVLSSAEIQSSVWQTLTLLPPWSPHACD